MLQEHIGCLSVKGFFPFVSSFSGYFKDNIFCHFVSSMISGLVTTAASMPVDIAKTR
jgi:hypothetical protein